MKKLLIRLLVIAALLFVMNWVYSKWFYEKDLLEHSDIIELPRQVVADSCQIVYLGESSNNTYGYAEADHRKISAMLAEYYPELRVGDMTKAASHAQTYYSRLFGEHFGEKHHRPFDTISYGNGQGVRFC